MVWSKFKSHFKCTGTDEKNNEDHLVDEINVNEEYIAAHRTNSYMEMLDKVEAQLRRKSMDRLTSSASCSQHTYICEFVLEPHQETIVSMFEGSNLHPLIISYFQSSFEACDMCALLLRSVHQVRTNYKIIQSVIIRNRVSDHKRYTNDQLHRIFDGLASFSNLNNSLMTIKSAQFRDINNSHGYLLRKLTSKFRHIRRKATLTRYCKKITKNAFVFTSAVLLIPSLIVSIHAMVGIFAAPAIAACSFGLVRKNKLKRKNLKSSLNERHHAVLEVAAKGVFIMINEFDTMSQLVKRLQDEIEHIKTIADMCAKNGKSEVLVLEVIKEFRIQQSCFLEQLEELEEHIYLCFLTINRSRMLVMQEIMVLEED